MERLAQGTKVTVRGIECTIQRHLGGGDYIVVDSEGRRFATNTRVINTTSRHDAIRRGVVLKSESSPVEAVDDETSESEASS